MDDTRQATLIYNMNKSKNTYKQIYLKNQQIIVVSVKYLTQYATNGIRTHTCGKFPQLSNKAS